jgi:hypothetical protein
MQERVKEYGFYLWVISVDPDLPAHPYSMIRMYTVRFIIKNNLTNLEKNSVDPDLTVLIY